MYFDVRACIQEEIFDYQTLILALKDFSAPRDKITELLNEQVIVRVKKGLYVFGNSYRRRAYSKELLANLVYGPSYVSLDSALSYHGLIPEGVEALTSVTTNRSRRFRTPVGLFTYQRIPRLAYEVGMTRIEADHDQAFLIASPEKALADKIVSARGAAIASQADMRRFLEDDLRIVESSLTSLSAETVADYAERYRSRKLKFLSAVITRLRRSAERRPR